MNRSFRWGDGSDWLGVAAMLVALAALSAAFGMGGSRLPFGSRFILTLCVWSFACGGWLGTVLICAAIAPRLGGWLAYAGWFLGMALVGPLAGGLGWKLGLSLIGQ